MAARQVRVLAGSASALAAVMLALAGCAAAAHPAAATVPRPASQAAVTGHARLHTAIGTVVRQASSLLKCADSVAPGRAGRGPGRQAGVASLSQPGLVVLCAPVTGPCPPGFRKLNLGTRPAGHRPRVLRYDPAVCIARFPGHPLPPEPRLTPVPVPTRLLHTLPPKAAGG